MTRLTRFLCVVLAGFTGQGCEGSDEQSEASPSTCATDDDCWNAPETVALGRCAPKDVYCKDGLCHVACARLCQTVSASINSCADAALVCNESASQSIDLSFCTGAQISCTSAADCPLYTPSDAGTWTCEGNVCRFPGFR